MTGAVRETHDQIMPAGPLQKFVLVDGSQVAARARRDRHSLRIEAFRQFDRDGLRRRGLQLIGPEKINGFVQLLTHARDDVVGLDDDGDVVDEINEDAEARQCQHDADADADFGNELVGVRAAHGCEAPTGSRRRRR